MKQAELFTKTFKEKPKDEVSINAELLIRAGFIDKLSAGIYTILPLGLKVINKIEGIVRQEMNEISGEEIIMPLLHPKELWEASGRWNVKEMYKIKDENLGLGWTHEEVVTSLMQKYILSANDLPKYIYQINTKFRNEPRAKSGLLRGREFRMKDLYSFHADEKDLDAYYERVKQAYLKIYERCGLKGKTFVTLAAGGEFSESLSHEFQTVTPSGEDLIYICNDCGLAINKEIFKGKCACGKDDFREEKSIEVGNIFKLGKKYSKVFGLPDVIMGCYGIGITRLMGAIVEVFNDAKGIIWPKAVAPFNVHLICIDGGDEDIVKKTDEIYSILQNEKIDVLYDNRIGKTAGEKFNDCDLIGIPLRVIVSAKTLKSDSAEIKKRDGGVAELVKIKDLIDLLKHEYQ